MTSFSVFRARATSPLIVRTIPRGNQCQVFARQKPRFLSSKEYSPNASNVRDPISSSPEAQAVNVARGKESRASDQADTRSTQSPISPNRRARTSEAHEGEEEGSFNEHIKNDPNASPEAKRQNVEKAGKKPLGSEDS